MHEMSLVQSLLEIVRQEMSAHQVTRLKLVTVKCGQISGVVPDALQMAFEALTRETDLDGARLEVEMVPLCLCCSGCGHTFSPAEADHTFLALLPCPGCGQEGGHRVLAGQELNIDSLEAE